MNSEIRIDVSQLKEIVCSLKVNDRVLLSGTVYTARDAAHKKMLELIKQNKELPFELSGAAIYYAGPTKAPLGLPIGSCGPTTSSRMDVFAPTFLDMGLTCMIGKGERSDAVCEAIIRNKAVYLCAIGGAGALACKCISNSEVIAFEELGCESVKKLQFNDFPLIVAIDCNGGNLFRR